MPGRVGELGFGLGQLLAVLLLEIELVGRVLDMLMGLANHVLLTRDQGRHLVEALVGFASFASWHFQDVFAEGTHLVITPDGPRGPVYQLGQGIIFLAQKCNAAIVPANMEYSSCWRFNSWDRFIVPRPFSKVRVILGAPLQIAQTTNPEEFESERVRLQQAVMNLVERR